MIAFIYRMQKSGALQHVPGGDQGQKSNDRMCALMAILIAMTPGVKVDDMVLNIVKEKYGERISQLESGNFNSTRELYVIHNLTPRARVTPSELLSHGSVVELALVPTLFILNQLVLSC